MKNEDLYHELNEMPLGIDDLSKFKMDNDEKLHYLNLLEVRQEELLSLS